MRNLFYSLTTICLIISCQKDRLPQDEASYSNNLNLTESTSELESRSSDHSVFGKVWEDHDGDGIQDFSDNGLPEIIVLLKSLTDSITVQEYVTDETGEYYFDIENEGDYFIKINIEQSYPDYLATVDLTSMSFSIESLDSDITHEYGLDTSTNFPYDYNEKLDFGFYKGGAIGNQVWLDNEGPSGKRNIFDETDLPIQGAIIKLYRINLMTGEESLIDTTITDEFGNYLFSKLAAADYFVQIEILNPTGRYKFLWPNVGDDETRDSDVVEVFGWNSQSLKGRTSFIRLGASEINLTTDIGIKETYFHPPPGYGTTSGPNGTVWSDSNADGLLNNGEPMMADIKIDLIDASNESIVQSVTTDTSGKYQFDRISTRIKSLYLQISQPRGYMLTKNVDSQDSETSDFNQKTRKTTEFKTAACPYYTFDAGLVEGVLILGRR